MLNDIDADLRTAPNASVLYLEGKTDLPMFFALLGVALPRDGVHGGVLVKGLKDVSGTGGSAVRARVEAASANGRPNVWGVIDGDGCSLADAALNFDAPFTGPLYTRKAYCLENLIAKTAWPANWGPVPVWSTELAVYAPYVALNRSHIAARSALQTLGLAKFRNPAPPLVTGPDIIAALQRDQHVLTKYDPSVEFQRELADAVRVIATGPDEAHALVNGKWIFRHWAQVRNGSTAEQAMTAWQNEVRASGGSADVRALWKRLTGLPP